MAKETNKGEIESICARVNKHASEKAAKANINLNWLWTIDFGLFWLYIYIHGLFGLFDAKFLTGFMIIIISFCSTCSKSMKSIKPNGNISKEWAKFLSFVWEKVLLYTKVKLSHY